MTLLDRVRELCKEKNISQRKLEKDISISNGASSKWAKSTPSGEVLQKLSNYFGVTLDYLITGEEPKEISKPQLTTRDEKDIAKDLDNIMEKLTNKEDGPASFNGEDMSEETIELFKDELERALRILKVINKEKYNPNKNKK